MRLAHYCTGCGHNDVLHTTGHAGYLPCGCCVSASRAQAEPPMNPEPTVLQTFAYPSGEREDFMHTPGSTYNAGTMHAVRLCDCAACQAKAEELATS